MKITETSWLTRKDQSDRIGNRSEVQEREQVIGEMVRRIVNRFSPERIILFGSHARGTSDDDSDVDLLVVMRGGQSRRQQTVAIRTALADLRVAKDIIVVSPDYFERYRDIVGTVIWPAVREGRVLYERAA